MESSESVSLEKMLSLSEFSFSTGYFPTDPAKDSKKKRSSFTSAESISWQTTCEKSQSRDLLRAFQVRGGGVTCV